MTAGPRRAGPDERKGVIGILGGTFNPVTADTLPSRWRRVMRLGSTW